MHLNGHSNGHSTNGTVVGALDMNKDIDRAMVRQKRWKISEEQRERYLKALDVALTLALQDKNSRHINACIKTIAALEAQNQTDELNDEKMRRMDEGKPTDVLQFLPPESVQRVNELVNRISNVGIESD